MIGQDKIINKISNINMDNLPHSLIILGDKGSGRHTIFNMVVAKMQLPFFDISDKLSHELIDEIYLKVEPIIYLINLDDITIKESNMILKMVEEPLKNAFIIFIAKTRASIIPTILNRCQIWEMEKYNEDQLRYFLTTVRDDYPDYFKLINYCDTPGQLLYLMQSVDILDNIKNMCDKIITYIGSANFANTLTISDKIAFKNEQDKWDYDIFIKILYKTVQNKLVLEYTKALDNMFIVTSALLKDSEIAHINKRHLFENYLCTCRYIMR